MKKIIIIIIILLSTGCVDYKELNSLSYVTGMGIDYMNDEFVVTYEVMDNKKEGSGLVMQTFTVTGHGDTTYEAIIDATNKLSTTAYFSHTQIIILSEEIVSNHLSDITDFVMRNPKLNEEFLLVMTSDATPEEILNFSTEVNPSAAFYISTLINDNNYSKNSYINMPFAVFVQKIAENKEDPAISIINIDGDEIILEGLGIFNNDNYIKKTDTLYGNIYNSFVKSDTNIVLTSEYDDDIIEAITKFENSNIFVTETDINIELDVIVELKKKPQDADLNLNTTYAALEKSLTTELKNMIINFIKLTQENNSDLLGLSNIYYINYRKDNNNLWQHANINLDIDLSISRKGLITNVHN